MTARNYRRRSRLAAAILIGMAVPAAAFAQDATTSSTDQAAALDAQGTKKKVDATLDKVEVTGSHIKRAQIEGPVPITVITADDIKKEGYQTLAEALQTLTQYTGDVVDGEFNVGNSAPDGEYLNLRGLGVGYQLILLNGKRMADYASNSGAGTTGISIGSIPLSAVARVEVLNGGASAIYGSDAVAGVVNIITKEGWDGNHVRVRGGATSDGGGQSWDLQYGGGHTFERGSITYAAEYLNRQPLYAKERDYLSYKNLAYNKANPDKPTAPYQGLIFVNGGTALAGNTAKDGSGSAIAAGTVNPANVYWLDSSGNMIPYTAGADGYADQTTLDAINYDCSHADPGFSPYYSTGTQPNPERCGAFDYYNNATLSNKFNKLSGYIAGNFKFTDDTEGYGQLLVMKSKDESSKYTSFNLLSGGYSSNQVYDPNFGMVSTLQRAMTFDAIGYQPTQVWDETALNANVGVRGTWFGKFDWDASVSLSRDELDQRWRALIAKNVQDYFYGPILGYVDDPNNTRYNGVPIREMNYQRMFGEPITADVFNSLTGNADSHSLSMTSQAQFTVSGPLFKLPGGDAQFAFVAEASHAHYQLDPDERAVYDYTGDDRFFNYSAVAGGGSRDRVGTGLEFNLPFYKWLTLSLAGRYDKYDDISNIGGNATWQAGLEIRPFSNLLLRASHQTSFLAPNIMWVYGAPVSQYGTFTDEYACRRDGLDLTDTGGAGYAACYGAGSQYSRSFWYTQSGNNTELKAETAKSDGYGFVWDAFKNFSISADYWRIELNNKSVYLDSGILSDDADCLMGSMVNGTPVDSGSGKCAVYEGYVQRDANGDLVSFTEGAINQSSVVTDGYDASAKYNWSWDALGNFHVTAGYTHVLDYKERTVAGDPWDSAMMWTSRVAFAERSNWTIGWNKGSWNASLYGFRDGPRWNYYATAKLAPYVQWNGSLSKQIMPGISISVDVTNLTNNHGPYDATKNTYPYPGYQPIYGVIGRAFYANLDIDF